MLGSHCRITKAGESQSVVGRLQLHTDSQVMVCMVEGCLWAAQVDAPLAGHYRAPKVAGQG